MSDKPTILFVDDEERILRSLKMLFMGKFKVKTTTDGHEAIDILKNETVHVLVSDQRMPNMTGVEVLREARNTSPNTMRLLLTGYSDLAAIVGSVNDGEIFRYVNKPWKSEEIKSIIEQAAQIAIQLDSNAQQEKAKALAQAATAATAKISSAESSENTSENTDALRILVLDDEPTTYEIILELIKDPKRLHWSKDTEDAFAHLSQENVSIVVSEVRIKDEDISAPLKSLKRYNPNILTLVLTSFQDTKSLIELINYGQVYRFLPKPIHKGLLEKSLRAAMQHYRAMEARPELLMRHAVEKPKEEEEMASSSISNKVMGYLKKIRARRQTQAGALH